MLGCLLEKLHAALLHLSARSTQHLVLTESQVALDLGLQDTKAAYTKRTI